MKDEFIITLKNKKKYRIKNVIKITKSDIKEKTKYVTSIDEKICNWKI